MFKVGDKVICIDISGIERYLSLNKIYTVSKVADYSEHIYLEEYPGDFWIADRFHLATSDNTPPKSNVDEDFYYIWPKSPYPTPWIPSEPTTVSTLPPMHNCECGVDSVGGGRHSTWCPKHV